MILPLGDRHSLNSGLEDMARLPDWKKEIAEGLKREHWAIRGPNCIVKVLPLRAEATALGGYITLGKFLVGKNPNEIEGALGLEKKYLIEGARIFKFDRIPLQHEYEYELTAKFPGGLYYNPAHSDRRWLPGDPSIQQWRILDDAAIPVDQSKSLELQPSQRVPYDWLVK